MNNLAYDINWEVKQIKQAISYYEDAKNSTNDNTRKKKFNQNILNLEERLRELKYEEYKLNYV
jgi:hypothetical protein